MKARHAKKLLTNLLRTNITVVPKGSRLIVHLPEEAMEHVDKWIGILKDMSEILEVRIAAVCAGVDVTVIGSSGEPNA